MTSSLKRSLWIALCLSVLAVLSWWRASEGRTGRFEMSVLWSIGAVLAWVDHLRNRRKEPQ